MNWVSMVKFIFTPKHAGITTEMMKALQVHITNPTYSAQDVAM